MGQILHWGRVVQVMTRVRIAKCHLIIDAHKGINEIPTVTIYNMPIYRIYSILLICRIDSIPIYWNDSAANVPI